MSKGKELTSEEFNKFTFEDRTLSYIKIVSAIIGLRESDMNILDWGCGRGRAVLWLRERGYNAFGVDIDRKPVENGLMLVKSKGYNESILRILTPDNKTDFPDGFFHFITSNQVFEHIKDIDSVSREMSRITIKNGYGYHDYPAPKYIVEGHLFMPFVHWFPKNYTRKYLITFYVFLGFYPKWEEFKNKSQKEVAEILYQYSIDKTYYRSRNEVEKAFEKYGFDVKFVTLEHPKIKANHFLCWLVRFNLTREIINWLLLIFKSHNLFLRKK